MDNIHGLDGITPLHSIQNMEHNNMSDEIDLLTLETTEILELIQDDLYDGLAEEVVKSVNELLKRGMTPYELLTRGLVAGMDVVGVISAMVSCSYRKF